MNKLFKSLGLVFILTLVTALVAACGGGQTDGGTASPTENETAQQEQGEEPAKLSGSVVIDGSGTVYPLMARLGEEFMLNEQPDVSVEVSRAGTGAGMKKFVVGETDFSNASRPIKEEELAELAKNNIESIEFKVALDGLTIVINPENTWATEMTADEIKQMFISGAIKEDDVVLWSDIRPDWPSEPINFYGPNENHGTNEFFVQEILEKQDLVSTITLQQEYPVLVDLVSKDKNAIAFFGFGYYVNNQDKLKAVAVDFGNGPVEPSLETISEDGPYAPFTRPVFTNLSVNAAKEKPQVKAFAEYVFTKANDFAGETGFAPLPQAELDANLERVKAIQ